ncbi:hypothetical protein KKD88_00120 [Patescibacteria group bacterium]|nr:hypothetical protein [Patescibacteria group bacterium]MBU1034609.1 hypothetical protein [Patescibacteria group bacterium]MBU1629469.1 hypothetical protein [Patescibacteria group bacterium]
MKKKTSYIFEISTVFLSLSLVFSPLAAGAETAPFPDGFDPNLILSDTDIFNSDGMSRASLNAFLRAKGRLADLRLPDIDGVQKTAADIIWRVSQSYRINPKYLLVLIQKEQSLVEDQSPSQNRLDWATGYGVCDSCSKNDPSIQEFKGFASQIEWAAKQHREKYLIQLLSKGLTIGGYGVGSKVSIDGQMITPANHATAMLYSYTPHLNGNINLWRIWQKWFLPTYPDGAVVRGNPSGKTYLIRFGEKKPFSSQAVVASITDPNKVIETEDTALAGYPDGAPIKFPPYSLLKNPKGEIFLLTRDAKRKIQDMQTFAKLSFNEDEIIDVKDEDLSEYPDGRPITPDTSFPQGTLVKIADQAGVWYVEDGERHPLVDAVFLRLYFNGWRIRTISEKEMEKLTISAPYTLRNGELVKSPSVATVYVVEEGALRPIPTAEIFEQIGWRWENIVNVPDRVLALHKTAEPFNPPRTETSAELASQQIVN